MIDFLIVFVGEHPMWLYIFGVVLIVMAIKLAMRTASTTVALPAVNTWRHDFDSWKNGDITIDEFLDRRWAFRKLR